MRLIPVGVAVVAVALYFSGLGDAPFLDPPEGVHTEVARTMAAGGDVLTPRLNGVRYLDKPPLLYWLMTVPVGVAGPTPGAARFWSAASAVACAAVTAWLGVLLGGVRVGLLAGLMVTANLGVFTYARLVKPDLLFLLCLTLAWAGFVAAYLGRGGRRGLALFYVALGLAALAKDVLGVIGPLAAVGLFFAVTRERPVGPWVPWWGPAAVLAVALPWYLAVEARNPGFLWYTVVDNHWLNFFRQRVFPDEDVPLSSLEFVAVTAAAFLPWAPAVPWALARALRGPRRDPRERLWLLLAVWALLVVGFFTLAPFKLPHYGLPAFPALALLVARIWDEAITAEPGAPAVRTLLMPVLVVFAAGALAAALARLGVLQAFDDALATVDVATRNAVARGAASGAGSLPVFRSALTWTAAVLGLAAAGLAVAFWRRQPELGVAVAVAGTLAFLPVAGRGMVEFARARAAAPVTAALLDRAGPDDLVVHEGPLENTASLLLAWHRPVIVVDGLQSNLAFGATFPDARGLFWDADRLVEAWRGPGRHFLISTVGPERSVVARLPAGTARLLVEAGGRRLYSNVGD
jgi:4-amino-4-deoxy-L-arabinose transferase-like glycosyltransferase